ncbi:hypothetical protein M406DRAFT_358175 [Cryphonectria parasitica EP155]|uniref:Uncharacterized protein n=1 Tax=Cryphonectria parasitica (strain ATCC 38755 / EP155) TaxID=660469 RepID=A0A9P4XVZ0_CRYP1|nr:uncharacterized protein M406DRAFT_358175 [Cryphonectria parasitica EP155]KAF3762013.1 hypothetical protein M406DRAFT_358175 [Cryphonectria parasitica EP155]
MSQPGVCPVVGTTNSVLPPSHPDVDLSKPGQTCPVVGAKTEHHGNLHKHPSVPVPADAKNDATSSADAQKCPALKTIVDEPKSKEMDDQVCPVVGPVTTILPPHHPSTEGQPDDAVCPVTKAHMGHHKGKVAEHPDVHNAGAGAVCPVVGARSS